MFNPDQVRQFYNEYGEKEWNRLDSSAYGRLIYHGHVKFMKPHIGPGKRVLDAGCGEGRMGSKGDNAMMKNPRLVKPSTEYMSSYIAACREYVEAGLEIYDDFHGENPTPELIKNLLIRYENQSRGIGLPEGWVPSSTFWLVDEEEYIGSGNIRYALTEPLKNFGGHIGYEIRPSKWGQGYGTVQLKLLLAEAAKLGIKSALLTCSTDNVASIRVIKKNGGVIIDCINNICQAAISKLSRV